MFRQPKPMLNLEEPADLNIDIDDIFQKFSDLVKGTNIRNKSNENNNLKCVKQEEETIINEEEEDCLLEPTASKDNPNEEHDEDDKSKDDKRPVSDCHVCGDRAIAHMHYGGICCYSCKAFFRRAVQSGKDKVYRCKRSGNCQVSLESRRSCQKCRFLKCLSVGMTSAWVLSEEQCTIRFGKNPGKCGRKRRISHSSDHEEDQKQIFQNHLDIRYILSDEDRRQVEQIVDLYEASKEMISFSENNH